MKPTYITLFCLFFIVLGIPSLIVSFSPKEAMSVSTTEGKPKKMEPIEPKSKKSNKEEELTVSVYRMADKNIENVEIEEYVMGVLSAEMPINFEIEALKAQAVAARTYTVRNLLHPDTSKLPQGADVTDSTLHQVYNNTSELKERWGTKYEENINKLKQAVSDTEGMIITYQGEPIDASFFSTSNGYTENSEDYWSASIPYLRSVPSPWDKDSPVFIESKRFTINEFESKVGVSISNKGNIGEIERTSSKRVASVRINEKKLSGKDLRESLGLKSTDFTFKLEGGHITITTKGNGHGVGMSQYGANGMAKAGKNYKDILKHYYTDIAIEDVYSNQILKKAFAKKWYFNLN